MIRLSVVIIAKNEEKSILRCLESVRGIADEIVVVDSMSTDNTPQLCTESGCLVFKREFDGYGSQKQFAVDQATHNWILSIDADEVVSPELSTEIRSWKTDPESGKGPAGFTIPFSLFFMGKILKHGGVGSEYHIRLFDRTRGRFTLAPVHEGIEIKGDAGKMKGRIVHYSYRDISHHLEKINIYTTQAASGYHARSKSFSRGWVMLKFPVSFVSFYLIKGGILDGYPGFMWSFLAAVYATLKVAKTIEMNER